MAYPKRVRFEAVRELGFAAIPAAYTAVGTATLSPVRLVRISNTTNQDVYISIDGVTNHLRIVTGSFILLDFNANKTRDDGFFMDSGTVFYVKRTGVAPTSGNVIIEVVYAR